eukprot:scaffold8751_cov69-Cylindrotheca_fusiformis.AAC.2
MEGSQSNLVLMLPSTDTATENVPSEIGLSLDMSGAFINETHACIPVQDKLGLFCIDFVADGCHLKNGDSDSRRHLMAGVEGHHYRRELFQAARGRRLENFVSVQDLIKDLIMSSLGDVLQTVFVPSHWELRFIQPISGGFRIPHVVGFAQSTTSAGMASGAVIGFVVLGSSMVPLAICLAFAAVPDTPTVATISFSAAGCLRVEKNGIHLTLVMSLWIYCLVCCLCWAHGLTHSGLLVQEVAL